jgi:hypothetical protein
MEGLSGLPLRGRERELTAVRRWLTTVHGGTGGVLVVEGSAGLGETPASRGVRSLLLSSRSESAAAGPDLAG